MADTEEPSVDQPATDAGGGGGGGGGAGAGATRRASVVGVEAMTLSQQANQVESDAPVKDPDTDVPYNLVMMPELTQELLLAAVKTRFEADGIYTFVGDILVALNPYQWIDMYGKAYKERYSPMNHVCQVPHVYGVAQAAAKNLRLLNRNQVCIISGESGSGKTETAKLFMHHLLEYSGGSAGHSTALERQILESQPLLEAFGNAKTGLNNNSSRFGKYIEVLYEGMDKVLGARVRKYLLEKSRVIHQVEGERNFHVFYYLCDGAPAALKAKLNLKDSSHYRYLQAGNGGSVENPSVWFDELAKCVVGLGFEEDVVFSMWTSIAAILKCGQLDFMDLESSVDDACTYTDEAVARDLADTLAVDYDKLTNALTTRHVVTVGEIFHRPLNAEQSRANRDVLAQNMYDNLFSWITDELNNLLSPSDDDDDDDTERSVAVLDIFGFENFEHNGFEQMFINTANEKLQHYFIDHIFTYEVRELKEEGIRAPKVEYETNEGQVETLLGDRGIFGLLDEQTKVPNANDATTIIKLHQELEGNKAYDNLRKSPIAFALNHYAGTVRYEVEGFLEKNRNQPSLGIAGMIKSSDDPMIASLFKFVETTEDRLEKDMAMKKALKSGDPNFMRRQSQFKRFGKKYDEPKKKEKPKKHLAPWQIANMKGPKPEEVKVVKIKRAGSGKRRAGLTTLSAAFKASLEDLMFMLNQATPHFVRCIKPNMTKTAKEFEGTFTQKQLNYTGVLETTKIRQNGYPLRLTFGEFCDRYRDTCIPATYKLTPPIMESTALRILQTADLHGWGKGKTKLFLKYEHVNVLINLIEGKKKAANAERAAAKAIQDKIDAEAAEIAAKREIEVAKIRAAAEAQPSSEKVTSSLSWQEEMAAAKEKKKAAKAEKKRREDEAAANAPPPIVEQAEVDEDAAAKARMKARFAMFGGKSGGDDSGGSPRAGSGSPRVGSGSPRAGSGNTASSTASPVARSPPAPSASSGGGGDSGAKEAASDGPCGNYRLDMQGKQFGDCKCGHAKVAH